MWVQLEFYGLAIDVHMEQWFYDAYCSDLHDFHDLAFTQFSFVVLSSITPHSWAVQLHVMS